MGANRRVDWFRPHARGNRPGDRGLQLKAHPRRTPPTPRPASRRLARGLSVASQPRRDDDRWPLLLGPRSKQGCRSVMKRPQLVELVTTASAAEAEHLARRLRRAGILALANAEPVHPDPGHVGRTPPLHFRCFVLVAEQDRERALAMIYADQVSEGSAPPVEILAELADHAERDREGEADCDGDGLDDDSGTAWQNRVWGERWHGIADQVWRWVVRLAWFVLGAATVYAVVRLALA